MLNLNKQDVNFSAESTGQEGETLARFNAAFHGNAEVSVNTIITNYNLSSINMETLIMDIATFHETALNKVAASSAVTPYPDELDQNDNDEADMPTIEETN